MIKIHLEQPCLCGRRAGCYGRVVQLGREVDGDGVDVVDGADEELEGVFLAELEGHGEGCRADVFRFCADEDLEASEACWASGCLFLSTTAASMVFGLVTTLRLHFLASPAGLNQGPHFSGFGDVLVEALEEVEGGESGFEFFGVEVGGGVAGDVFGEAKGCVVEVEGAGDHLWEGVFGMAAEGAGVRVVSVRHCGWLVEVVG